MESKKEKKPELKYYNVEVEVLIPGKIKYQVLAESPEQAVEKMRGLSPTGPPSLRLSEMRRLAAKVYDYGTVMMRYMTKLQ